MKTTIGQHAGQHANNNIRNMRGNMQTLRGNMQTLRGNMRGNLQHAPKNANFPKSPVCWPARQLREASYHASYKRHGRGRQALPRYDRGRQARSVTAGGVRPCHVSAGGDMPALFS
jgi:hypothetical protein